MIFCLLHNQQRVEFIGEQNVTVCLNFKTRFE